MYRNILVPTDGSRLAAKGIRAGVKLAKALGAKVTGVYVIPPYIPPIYSEAAVYSMPGVTAQDYKRLTAKSAKKALAVVEIQAGTAGARCTTHFVTASRPWKGILKVARARKCDVVAMASHGRGGIGGLLLGSETNRVLAHSRIPVLVSR